MRGIDQSVKNRSVSKVAPVLPPQLIKIFVARVPLTQQIKNICCASRTAATKYLLQQLYWHS
jgi:hypothetical protein